MKSYPSITQKNPDAVYNAVQQIVRLRKDDINDYNALPSRFIGGRRTNRIPSTSTDIQTGDAVGDICITPTFIYCLVNNSGTPEWVRTAVSTF